MLPDSDSLKGIEIFSKLRQSDLHDLGLKMTARACGAGEVLFREGDLGQELFVVARGRVAISVRLPTGEDLQISEAGPGSFFGEMSIIEQAPRSATCRALEDGLIFSLRAEDFNALVREQPRVSVSLMKEMLNITTGRLLRTGAFLSQMVQWGETARKRAITDEATGLFNRRFMDDALERIVEEARSRTSPLSMVMFDLDHFGDLNKAHGQSFGDQVIVQTSKVFREVFRPTDFLVRYGGDEFTFLLPETASCDALGLCNEVCERIRRLRFSGRDELRLTSSMGVAAYPEHAETTETLKDQADKALYRAKEEGRDRALAAMGTPGC